MIYVFNLIVIAVVVLIAYWWANQGLFSAILHLLCVIAAGAIALSLWEPVTVNYMLRGSGFDDFAWGLSLVGMFVVILLILRVATNKLIPANVAVPSWANWAFGLPIGAVSGILSAGILVIGAGFIQSTREIMGLSGAGRAGKTAIVGVTGDQRLWLPVHEITYEFFAWLSVTSLSTDQPLRQWYPRLDWQAVSLLRDSWGDGAGKLSLKPDAATVQGFYSFSDEKGKHYVVKMRFDGESRDWGEQLTLSRSQVRLIAPPKNVMDESRVAHPDSWIQPVWGDPGKDDGRHRFDDISHYISSVPGQESVEVAIEFSARDLEPAIPKFIQVRGTRYRLPKLEEDSASARSLGGGLGGNVTLDAGAADISSAFEITNSIRPLQISTNNMPSGMSLVEDSDGKFFSDTGGNEVEFQPGGDRPARALAIKGIFEPKGTRIVRLDVSRESPANIYGAIRDKVKNENDPLMLVDSNGQTYTPIGYFYEKADRHVMINLEYRKHFPSFDMLPMIPTSGGNRLYLLFTVTAGATITGFKWGDATVGTCNVAVAPTTPVTPGSEFGG